MMAMTSAPLLDAGKLGRVGPAHLEHHIGAVTAHRPTRVAPAAV